MAEARAAVAFSFKVTEEGVDINVNREALFALYFAFVKSCRRRWERIKNSIKNQVYPFRLSSWPLFTLGICVAIHIGWDFSHYGMAAIEDFSFKTLNIQTYTRLVSIALFSLIMWLMGVMLVRYTLWILLSYMSWMYEPRGTMCLRTKIWIIAMRLLSSKESRLYGYQSSLPKLPVPKVKDTIERFLLSVKHLLTGDEYTEIEQLAIDFKMNISFKLQCFLHLKSFLTPNYISDWWEDYVYLHGRGPIMINSNFYVLDLIISTRHNSQTAKAANLIYLMIQHRQNIDRENLKPIFINNTVPLCSSQYERQFNTTRIPGETKDYLIHYNSSQHIVVMHRGKFYRVMVQNNDGFIRPVDIEQSLIYILDDDGEASEAEGRLAALTAGDRIPWAQSRQKYFSRGVNKASLDIIDRAAFVVVLDEVEYHCDANRLSDFARAGLVGSGCNRWFDKSMCLYVGKNGMSGLNVEHSWADAPITSHLWEVISAKNFYSSINSDGIIGYTPDNHCVGTAEECLPPPYRLKWKLRPEVYIIACVTPLYYSDIIFAQCAAVINQSYEVARRLSDELDLYVLMHDKFGKGAMKVLNVSPDAFIQIALQVAYYRDMKKFALTYEASMTRLFRDGRTETARSCTNESCEFVRAFCDESVSSAEKKRLFKVATERHQDLYRDSMTGKGVDRHLFSLYVVSKYLGIKSPFLQKVLNEPWLLSTSQTPVNQCNLLNHNKHPLALTAGGGFGPVVDDGYGVSYLIAGENHIFLHVSSKNTCPDTSSEKMAKEIEVAFSDIKSMLEK